MLSLILWEAIRRIGVLAVAVAAAGAAVAAPAPLSSGEKTLVNFAFATQLGSGIYTIEDRTIQVYRLPFSYTFRQEGPDRVGLRLTVPVTIGFYDFRPEDVIDSGIPDNLDTASLVPGLEVRVLAKERWLLRPFFEAGVAREGSNEANAYVASVGLRSIAGFPAGSFDLDLGNGLVYTRVDPAGSGADDDLIVLNTSFQARHLLGAAPWGHELEFGPYVSADVFFDDADYPLDQEGRSDVRAEYEAGITFGTRETVKIFKIPIPRVGIGYRFGADTSAFRLVFGVPTPSLKR